MKLPKEIQKKEKSKPKRPTKVKKRPGSQYSSRSMRRRMQQQGIDMDQIDATRVIIEGTDKTIIINQPEVMKLNQMGQEIYQVVGQAEEREPGDIDIGEEYIEEGEIEEERIEEERIEEEARPTITQNDIMLVAAQANVPKEEAEAVLRECEGDIAKAIVLLKNR
ncbi:MAG: Nascent polypeptide-associated complex protein [Promethearchaeota archaeon]|nr:MAG: Nascent polypeptide-associated complex protein [Candidatus Lokiarchaeota archaeon]